ncbi:hypothetical protein BJ165DRAFT_1364948 [Panaeolus papilionaceus]|nr:hypothetical protein BJ165DRAFT_1364948 [Panaeolus papilionaceus]
MQPSDAQNITLIEGQISGLQRQICDLQCRRNSFLPISRLPPELLCRVFVFIRESVPYLSYNIKDIPPWVKLITHVCRHWRETAHGCPQLWSKLYFDLSPPSWMQLQLQRSKDAPLSIFSNLIGTRPVEGLLNVLGQPHRLRMLSLCGFVDAEELQIYFGSLCNVSAPKLENLVLHLRSPVGSGHSNSLPPNLFLGGTPALHHLDLRGLLIPLTSPVYHNLSTLTLQNDDTSVTLNPRTLFGALSRCPNLQLLDVAVHLPEEIIDFHMPRSIVLKDLKSLRLRSCFLRCASLVKHLAIPLSATVDIQAIDDILNDVFRRQEAYSDAKAFASALDAAWLSNPLAHNFARHTSSTVHSPRRSIRALRLKFGYADRMELELGFQNHEFGSLSTDGPWPGCPLRINVDGNFSVVKHFISDPLTMDQLDSAVISGYSHKSLWPRLKKLPNLRSVYIDKPETYNFFQCINDDPAMHRHGEGASLAETDASTLPFGHFANVTNIAFDRGNFGASVYDNPHRNRDTPIDFNAFLSFLKFRFDRQAPIRRLRFHRCINLFSHHIQQIESYVSDVFWDRHEEEKNDWHLRRNILYHDRDSEEEHSDR